MKTLTIEHLAPYLPYGLLFMYRKRVLVSSGLYSKSEWNYVIFKNDKSDELLDNVKPILRPLSDLTKEIEHNGERFVPIVEIARPYAKYCGYAKTIIIHRDKCLCCSKTDEVQYYFDGNSFIFNNKQVPDQYPLFQKLFQWHFDVFGLIPDNLAIDKNII